MEKTVLIIDDEHLQNNALKKNLADLLPEYQFEAYSNALEISYALENRFCTLVVLNIRMDKPGINGVEIANKIFELNPIAHVVLMSPDKEVYDGLLATVLKTGKIIDIVTKEAETYKTAKLLQQIIINYYERLSEDISVLNTSLLHYYSDAKNETDLNKKGLLLKGSFVYFLVFLDIEIFKKERSTFQEMN